MTDLRHYDVIVSPAITEKSTMASENNQVVFKHDHNHSPWLWAGIHALFIAAAGCARGSGFPTDAAELLVQLVTYFLADAPG